MQPICPKCGHSPLQIVWGVQFCGRCGWSSRDPKKPDDDDEREVVPEPNQAENPLEPLSRIHAQRILTWKGEPFIAVAILEMYDDYYDHSVGDVISVMGPGGSTVYFELAALISAVQRGDEAGYYLIRIDPDTEFDKLPVLDLDPGEMALELHDAAQEADQSGDEAP
jgi:hypothetical protein